MNIKKEYLIDKENLIKMSFLHIYQMQFLKSSIRATDKLMEWLLLFFFKFTYLANVSPYLSPLNSNTFIK